MTCILFIALFISLHSFKFQFFSQHIKYLNFEKNSFLMVFKSSSFQHIIIKKLGQEAFDDLY